MVDLSASNMRIFRFHFATFAALCYFTCSNNINKTVADDDTALFVFGDSVYDPGNSNFLDVANASYWPYGETFFHFPTGRFCDGRIIPDFVATYMGLPLWRPYLQPGNHSFLHGANFAAAGAAILPGDNPNGTVSFFEQISYFEEVTNDLIGKLGEENATKLLNKAIYLCNIGGIDYVMEYEELVNGSEKVQQEFVDMVIGNLTEAVKEIYRFGGRKFVFQNVAPLGCMPANQVSDGECNEELNVLASLHNEALAEAAAGLQNQLSGLKYLVFDYYNSFLDRMKNPSEYGFENGINACYSEDEPYTLCSDPYEYLWFDIHHPTEHGYMQLAKLLWEGGSTSTTPYTMKQLFELNQLNWSSSK